MRVSVIVVTARPGGIDVLLAGLSHQTFTDFEIVLVDALYDWRHDVVADMFHQAKIPLVHTPPRQRIFPHDACPQARNAGIAKSSGELLLWLVDYTYLPSTALYEHWGVFQFFEKKRAGMGAHRYCLPPSLAYELPDYAPRKMFVPNAAHGVTYGYDEKASQAFVDDLNSGFYDKYMYSVFAQDFSKDSTSQLVEDPDFFQVDPKLRGIAGHKISGNFFHAKNESMPRALAIAANGFDEAYTGHLYDDTDFGHCVEHLGGEWALLVPDVAAVIINPRHLFPHLLRQASTEAHRARYDARRLDPDCTQSENAYSLASLSNMTWWY